MKRIDSNTKAVNLHGVGKHGFTNGDPQSNISPTELTADHFNQVQEEIARLIEAADLTLDGADLTQLRKAVGLMIRSFLPEYTAEFGKPMLYRSTQFGDQRDTWYAYRQVVHALNTASGGTASASFETPNNSHFSGSVKVVVVRTDDSSTQAGYNLHFHGRNVGGVANINHEDTVYGDDGGLAILAVFMDFSGSTIKLSCMLNALPAAKKYNLAVEFELISVTRFAP